MLGCDKVMLYAASLPKIGILVGVMDQLKEVRDLAFGDDFNFQMMTVSNNQYASWGLISSAGQSAHTRRPLLFLRQSRWRNWLARGYGGSTHFKQDPIKIHPWRLPSKRRTFRYVFAHVGVASDKMHLSAPPGHHHKLYAVLGTLPGVEFWPAAARAVSLGLLLFITITLFTHSRSLPKIGGKRCAQYRQGSA
jgi:hypothetical protein